MRSTRTSEPGKLPAALLAILVHLGFVALLVFGVTWRTHSPAPVTAELWQSLPSPPKVAPVQPPQPRQEVPPPEPKPEPRPEPKPKPEPKAEPEPPKPDIALKKKEEKQKREQEQEQIRKDLGKQKKEDQERQKKEKEDEIKKQKIKDEQARKAVAEKEAREKAQAEQAAKAAGDARVNDYIAQITAKIKSNTIIPQDVVGNPQVVYEITLLPGGDILNIRLVKSSGISSYDEAAERAIRKSAPLPVPSGDLFQSKFRVGNYQFRPNDQ